MSDTATVPGNRRPWQPLVDEQLADQLPGRAAAELLGRMACCRR